MDKFIFPNRKDIEFFVDLIQKGNYSIKKYLPKIDENWFAAISDEMMYIEQTCMYEPNLEVHEILAKIIYKVAKRHELSDGNKRTSVIAAYLFCLLNDYYIKSPKAMKNLAKRIARTKGRKNEDLMRRRAAVDIVHIIDRV